MSERDLFVICPSCSSEVSPYVTECPYCGKRLRKRAPDLKKQAAAEAKAARREEKKRERLRAQYEGGGERPGSWLERSDRRSPATFLLVGIAVIASLLATTSLGGISSWAAEQLVFVGTLEGQWWTVVTSPFLQYSFGYGFVCLFITAVFAAGIEQRFGWIATVSVWLLCGALGVVAEWLIAPVPVTFGAYAIAVGFVLSWTLTKVATGELRNYDTLGLGAVAAVLCLLPVATGDARVATLIGGIVGGLLCGGVLGRIAAK